MASIKPAGDDRCDEKLAAASQSEHSSHLCTGLLHVTGNVKADRGTPAVGVCARVGHAQIAGRLVLQFEVLILHRCSRAETWHVCAASS